LRERELLSVATKKTQALGFRYFWISSLCGEVKPEDIPTGKTKREVQDSDVS